jgi:ADP-ribose pyrophosphatase YjhB (NUDIX family)
MRETIEMGETIESAVHRGLLEELGIEGNIVSFLGSIVSDFYRGAVRVEKTTLYFLCTIRTFDPERRPADDPDTANAVQWIDIDSLVTKSREQGERCSRSDFDEEPILRRAKEYLKDNSVGRS